jgi:hypothetical protein
VSARDDFVAGNAPDIGRLDIADGLKQLLFEKNCDVNFLLKSDAATLAQELGIEKYVAQVIIDAARKAITEYFLSS